LPEKKQKIPILLKLKRFKNSDGVEKINSFFSIIKPRRKFNGIPKSILLIRNDRIGDAVVTLPVIRDLKLNYPEMKIDVLVSHANKFVFDDIDYADDIIELNWAPQNTPKPYMLPVIGGILQFIRFALISYLTNASYRNKIKFLHSKKYDAAVDLVGLSGNALLCKHISRFSIGPKKFVIHTLYSYYLDTNWVSAKDNDQMTNKITHAIEKGLDLKFEKKNTSLPLLNIIAERNLKPKYDIIFHLGASELRKLSPEKENKLIDFMSSLKVLVTNSHETDKYKDLKKYFKNNSNIEFIIYNNLQEAVPDCLNSRLLLCYDGGQAHYLSQFVKTITIFGPGSTVLWRPFEFSDYSLIEESTNGAQAFQSNGKFGHISVYMPIWCRPCFDVGCNEKPCLSKIEPEFIWEIINKYCLAHD
jgi:ADP-heptose:LPS heptosyltransferase